MDSNNKQCRQPGSGWSTSSDEEDIGQRFDGTRARCPGDTIEDVNAFVADFEAICQLEEDEKARKIQKQNQKKSDALLAQSRESERPKRRTFLIAKRRFAEQVGEAVAVDPSQKSGVGGGTKKSENCGPSQWQRRMSVTYPGKTAKHATTSSLTYTSGTSGASTGHSTASGVHVSESEDCDADVSGSISNPEDVNDAEELSTLTYMSLSDPEDYDYEQEVLDEEPLTSDNSISQNDEGRAPLTTRDTTTSRRAPAQRDDETTEIPLSKGRDSDGVYHVEKITSARIAVQKDVSFGDTKDIEYRVKWTGWPTNYNSWEPNDHFYSEYSRKAFYKHQLAQSKEANTMKKSDLYKLVPPRGHSTTTRQLKIFID